MKEYIVPLYDTETDWDEMFVGAIRTQEELIRCKDCKFVYKAEDGHWCECSWYPTEENGFCHNAERKEE